jgi:hypothetical protein
MCSFRRPPHLLLFDHPLADHLINGGLHKAGSDPFPIAIALAIVGDELLVIGDVSLKLLRFLQQSELLRAGFIRIQRKCQSIRPWAVLPPLVDLF